MEGDIESGSESGSSLTFWNSFAHNVSFPGKPERPYTGLNVILLCVHLWNRCDIFTDLSIFHIM